jgi:rubrerythrin
MWGWKSMYVRYAATFMILPREIRKGRFPPERLSRAFPKTGSARFAAPGRMNFRLSSQATERTGGKREMGKTEDALYQAYTGEAKAALRLKVFAEKAEEEGYKQMAKLFRVVAFSEEIHGARALRVLGRVKGTEENLAVSFESEIKVAEVAYDQFVKDADMEGNRAAALHFSQSKDVEEIHAKLYKEAMGHFMEERDTAYYVCHVCGYISDGILPEECPVCGALREQFALFD